MSSKYLLVISKDYWGTQTSEKGSMEFSKKLSLYIDISNDNITHLIGTVVSLSKIKQTMYSFIKTSLLNNSREPKIYIYMNGHGNQTHDLDGDEIKQEINPNETNIDSYDELYQLPDGSLIDDELTKIIDSAVFDSGVISRPLIFIISDHCSSGSMIDKTQKYFDWVSFGSSLDNQDSFVTGDGNVMTSCFIDVLDQNKDDLQEITSLELFNLLKNQMKNSFIGELQLPTFHVSNSNIMDLKLFN